MYLCPCQTLLTVSEAQLVEIEGGHGEDPLMKPPQGTQTAGAVTELLKPCFCQHETAQHQLSSSHVSAKSSEKSIQPSNKHLCACQTPNLNPAFSMLCSSGYRQERAHVCQHCPTSMVAQELDFAPAMPQFSSQLLGIVSPVLQKCSALCLMTLPVHTAFSTNTLVTFAGSLPFPWEW